MNWAIAAAIIAVLGCMQQLDNSDEWVQSDALIQEQREAARIVRFEKASQMICGENASFVNVGDGAIQCVTKHGHKISTHASSK